MQRELETDPGPETPGSGDVPAALAAGGREARQGRQSGSSLSLGSIDGPLESAESNPGADAHLVTTVSKKTGKSWSLQANCKETAEFRSGRE